MTGSDGSDSGADGLEERDNPDRDDEPQACPDCGQTDLRALYEAVTDTVSQFVKWDCPACDWSGSPPWKCGSTDTTTGEPCGHTVSDPSDRCHLHPTDGPKPDAGAPEGNDNAVGNDGGAPVGNTNGMKHGQYMSLERRLSTLSEDQRQRFEVHYTDFLSKAENKGTAVALATAEVLRESIADRLLEADQNGELWETVPVTDDNGEPVIDPRTGEPVTTERLRRDDIGALKGLMSELRLGKKYEGINDNQDSSTQSHGNAALLWDDADGSDSDADAVPDQSGRT